MKAAASGFGAHGLESKAAVTSSSCLAQKHHLDDRET